MTPSELRDVASDLLEALSLLEAEDGHAPTPAATWEGRARMEAVAGRLTDASAAEDLRALQAVPDLVGGGVRDLDAEPAGPLPDAVRALDGARRYLREELASAAEWKDAAQLVPYLAGVLAEVLPAAVHASAELPAAAATRVYWDAYMTGDPEPDADDLDEALRRQEVTYMAPYLSPPSDPEPGTRELTYAAKIADDLVEAVSRTYAIDSSTSIDLPDAAVRVHGILDDLRGLTLTDRPGDAVLAAAREDLAPAAAQLTFAANAWNEEVIADSHRAFKHLGDAAIAIRGIVARLRGTPEPDDLSLFFEENRRDEG